MISENRDSTNLPDKDRVAIQTLISRGQDKAPTWCKSGTNFMNKITICGNTNNPAL